MRAANPQPFTARIILDLDARILACNINHERNILFAQKAFVLARHSFVAEAKDLILKLRAINQSFEPRLSAWIMFAEGITEYSETLNTPKSKDRVLRSHLVAQVGNDPSLAATAAAWMAFFNFAEGKYLESADYLSKAFSWSRHADAEARSRAAMVLGMAFIYAGDPAEGRVWMQRARQHAIDSGDIAMQNIIFFNTSSYSSAQLTISDCISTVDQKELNFALMSADSSKNLNSALGIANQSAMIPVHYAELLTIAKRWADATDLFDQNMDLCAEQGQRSWVPRFLAQRAWCKANLGRRMECIEDIQGAMQSSDLCADPDDKLVLHMRVAGAADLLGDTQLSEVQRALGQEYLSQYRNQQASLLNTYRPIALKADENKNPA